MVDQLYSYQIHQWNHFTDTIGNPNLPKWAKVEVLRRAADGEPYCYQNGVRKKYEYLMDTRTGQLFWDDNPNVIAFKCGAITLLTPVYTVGLITVDLLRIVFDICDIAYRSIRNCFQEETDLTDRVSLIDILDAVAWDLLGIIRAPFYAALCMCHAAYGLYDPYAARQNLSQLLQNWHDGKDYTQDIRFFKRFNHILPIERQEDTCENTPDEKNCLELNDLRQNKVFFIGYCMLNRGDLATRLREGDLRYI